MSKQPTSWRRKGRTTPTVDYDAPAVDYDSSTAKYADNGETHDSVIKQPSAWSKRVKAVTQFLKNPAAILNDTIFDTDRVYDVAATYDGIVAGESHSTAKKATAWSKQ
jgi:hypothetical protein